MHAADTNRMRRDCSRMSVETPRYRQTLYRQETFIPRTFYRLVPNSRSTKLRLIKYFLSIPESSKAENSLSKFRRISARERKRTSYIELKIFFQQQLFS